MLFLALVVSIALFAADICRRIRTPARAVVPVFENRLVALRRRR